MKILEVGDIVIISNSVYKVTRVPDNSKDLRCRVCDCDNVSGCQSFLRNFIKNRVSILGSKIINNYYCHDMIGMGNILKKVPTDELLISWKKYCRRQYELIQS